LLATHLGTAPYAGIEIALNDDWKTYWRHPGDAGGIPPELEWTGSTNLATTELLYPAPSRLVDAAGITVGYKHRVLFPVRLAPKIPSAPVALRLALAFGICRDICIPAEARFDLTLPPPSKAAADDAVATAISEALNEVPRQSDKRRPNDPRLASFHLEHTAPGPRLVFAVDAVGADPATVDAFAETLDATFIPQPRRGGPVANRLVPFTIALNDAGGLAELQGKTVRLTLTSASGASEFVAPVPR
jgi:DsbC/DsbD-like thiol-disulfide interchange protein